MKKEKDIRGRYVRLVRASVLNHIYIENEARINYLLGVLENGQDFDQRLFFDTGFRAHESVKKLAIHRKFGRVEDDDLRKAMFAHTMIGADRIDNVIECAHRVINEDIPGDLMECGVLRGGAVVMMRAVLEAYDSSDRKVWVADSFQGLPKPSHEKDGGLDISPEVVPSLKADAKAVRSTFHVYDLMDEKVKFVKGWFHESLPKAPIQELALLRIDADLYKSTMDCLNSLYGKVSRGGFVIMDDYYLLPQAKDAVDEFRQDNNISNEIVQIDWNACYWRKS